MLCSVYNISTFSYGDETMKKLIRLIACTIMLVLAMVMLACTPTNLEKAEEKMGKAGYNVSIIADENAEGVLVASKGNERIMAMLFQTKEQAEEFYNNDYKMLAFILYDIDNAVLDGKWIYSGTAQSIKDFK